MSYLFQGIVGQTLVYMRYVALDVFAVQVNFVVVAKPCYSVNAVYVIYPLVVTLLCYKVIAVVDVFG